MQVKKFEAKSMPEALQLIKQELGPDAIILSVKDTKKGFGLLDGGSVEVTAAVSEKTLHQKKLAERRIREQDVSKFRNAPATAQKKFLDKMYKPVKQAPPAAPVTSRPYVEIDNEAMAQGPDASEQRIKSAVEAAKSALFGEEAPPQPQRLPQVNVAVEKQAAQPPQVRQKAPAPARQPSAQISNLENEVKQLKQMISQLTDLPKMMNSVYPGSEFGLRYELSKSFQKLVKAGISKNYASELLADAQDELELKHLKKQAYVEAWLVKNMMDRVPVSTNPSGAWIHCFLGGPGSGKTSSLVKMAGDLVVNKKKRVAILTTDVHKVGAVEQMRIFAQILNAPFGTVTEGTDWEALKKKLGDFDHVLIDYPGLKLNSESEIELLKSILPPSELRTLHFVASLSARDRTNVEFARRYRSFSLDDAIFTNLDEASHFGFLYNFCNEFSLPLHSFGIGRGIPDDFEYATRERVVDLIFKISKRIPRERHVEGGAYDE